MTKYIPAYDEHTDSMGYVILERISDHSTVYLQGDNAATFLNDQSRLVDKVYPHGPFTCYEEHLDVLIDPYF